MRSSPALRRVAAVALLGAAACGASREGGGRDAAAMAEAPPPPADAATVDAPPAAELVIPAAVHVAGTSSTVTFEATIDLDLDFGGFDTVTSTRQSKRKKVSIVRVDADGTVHKRITYLKRKTDMVIDGHAQKDETPLRGKTFRVTWKRGVVNVRRHDGKAATKAERDAVRAEEGQFQSPEFLATHLAGLRLVQDVPYVVPTAAMEQLITSDFRPRRLVITYRGKDGDHERLDAQASLASDGEAMRLFVDLDAELVLDRTGWCLEADVGAQVRAEFNGVVVGSGAGTGVVRASPSK